MHTHRNIHTSEQISRMSYGKHSQHDALAHSPTGRDTPPDVDNVYHQTTSEISSH